jgi:hypothetical protein
MAIQLQRKLEKLAPVHVLKIPGVVQLEAPID